MADQTDKDLATAWWRSLPNGACVNQMWEEAASIPVDERVVWLWQRYKHIGSPQPTVTPEDELAVARVLAAARYAGWCECLDSVRASLKSYPTGGGDKDIMLEVTRLKNESFLAGKAAGRKEGMDEQRSRSYNSTHGHDMGQ